MTDHQDFGEPIEIHRDLFGFVETKVGFVENYREQTRINRERKRYRENKKD
ncbi:MAG: hypothetical protein QXX30_03100 [Candidatus Aenigmatarchaeota archaeon]